MHDKASVIINLSPDMDIRSARLQVSVVLDYAALFVPLSSNSWNTERIPRSIGLEKIFGYDRNPLKGSPEDAYCKESLPGECPCSRTILLIYYNNIVR